MRLDVFQEIGKMKKKLEWFVVVVMLVPLISFPSGCSKEEATESLKKAEDAAEHAAETIADDTEEVIKEGEELAEELGEKALAYLTPLKEKFGNLDGLKGKPAELKVAVADLIKSIEEKAEDIELPEAVSNALAAAKDKLVALKEYLEGEVEQAKVEEHIQDIVESIKSGLGMS
jgi:hypothetical protein